MKTLFDTDGILFGLLKNGGLNNNGGVYVGDTRPNDSILEDIVVNSIDIEQDALPQIGTSNVNIYVADMNVNIGGRMMLIANRQRLDELSTQVLNVMRNTKIDGCKATPANITILAETNIGQHYVNIRVNWNIQSE